MNTPCAQCPARVQVERLRDRVDELEQTLGVRDVAPVAGLTPMAAKLLGVLLRRQICTRDTFATTLWTGSDLRASKTIDMHLGFVRRYLAGHGITLQNRRGAGWYIEAADKARLRACPEMAHDKRPARGVSR